MNGAMCVGCSIQLLDLLKIIPRKGNE